LKIVRATVTRAGALRYRLGMKQNLVWLGGLVTLSVVVACGETSNLVGEEPTAGSSGSDAGVGGSAAGKSSAGAAPGGTKSTGGAGGTGGTKNMGGTGGSAGSAGKPPTGGSDPGVCKDLGGNWQSCDNGVVHREKPGTCPSILPRAEAQPATASGLDECTLDSDCTEKANGYCTVLQGGFLPVEPHNICAYGCTTDADCGQTDACLCGADFGTCASSRYCRSDQDCTAGMLCTQFDSCPGVPIEDFACQTAADECRSNQDCNEAGKQFCSMEGDHRVCVGLMCEASAAP
jgi:hypothetical protein